jgi:hypothetical protein
VRQETGALIVTNPAGASKPAMGREIERRVVVRAIG